MSMPAAMLSEQMFRRYGIVTKCAAQVLSEQNILTSVQQGEG